MKASVIIPMYNAEKTVNAALGSLAKQSEHDFEVLMVDDCSTDKTVEICKLYSETDCRFRLINQARNMGASAARNVGINSACGEYLVFMDSDDVAHIDFVKKLTSSAFQSNSDITWCNFQYVSNNRILQTDHGMSGLIEPYKYIECYIKNTTGTGCMWNKAYRREFVIGNSLKIDENRIYGEDWDFNFRAALCKPRVTAIADILYDYIQYDNSISRKYYSSDYENYCNSLKMMIDAIELYHIETDLIDLNCRYIYDIVSLLQKLAYSTLDETIKTQEFNRISNCKFFRSVLSSTPWGNKRLTFKQNLITVSLRFKLNNLAWLLLKQ